MSVNDTSATEVSLPRRLSHAVTAQKANPFRILKDVAKLTRRPNRLKTSEYLLYRPWSPETEDAAETFVGVEGIERINASWIGAWADLTNDRLTINTLLRGFDLAIPEIQAVYGERHFLDTPQLSTRDEVLLFLREQAQYPLLYGPVRRDSAVKSTKLLGYNGQTDELQLSDDRAIGAESLAAQIVEQAALIRGGFLFENSLRPHPKIDQWTNGRPGTIRVYCLSDQDGAEILRASWRIPCHSNANDSLLEEGNLLAGIDPDDGRITQVIRSGSLAYEAVEHHPDTGEMLDGVELPDRDDVRSLVLRAVTAISDCVVQAWDVAITAQGPVLLGLQAGGGDPMISQLGFSRGILEGRYAEFAEKSLANQRKQRKNSWDEVKGNMSQQMSNLQLNRQESPPQSPPNDPANEAAPTAFQLDTEAKTDFSFSQRMMHAVANHKANLVTIVSDIAKLSRTPNRIPPYEYFLYHLWDESRFDLAAKQTFVGSDGWVRINKAMGNMWREIAEDKLAISAILRAHGLPIPDTQAIYHGGRHFPNAEQLTTPEEVGNFLRDHAVFPLFGKPVGGQQSCGAVGLDGYDATNDTLLLSSGESVIVDEFIRQITVGNDAAAAYGSVQLRAGYLFQSQLKPHQELVNVAGPRTGTVRMVCVADDSGIELVRASWKIPAGTNAADNLWRSGNMLGGIDLETGKLQHVVKPGPLECESVQDHPDSGASLVDWQFPEWAAMRELVEHAAATIHDCPFQGWDVALCEDGPVLVELQAGGGNPVLAQLGYDRGLLQGRYAEQVARALRQK